MSNDDDMARLREMEGILPDPVLSPALATAIFENSADGKIVVVMETRIIKLVNRTAEFLFGYHRTELVGRPIEMLVPDEARMQHEIETSHYAAEPRQRPMGLGRALQGRHRSGRLTTVQIMLSPISISEGQYVLATIRPQIGERKTVLFGNPPLPPVDDDAIG